MQIVGDRCSSDITIPHNLKEKNTSKLNLTQVVAVDGLMVSILNPKL